MTHIFRLCAFCLAALGCGLILDGYGVFAVARPRIFASAVAAQIPVGLKAGLKVEVVDTLIPAPLGSRLNPCLPTPRIDLALLRPSLVRA